MVKLLSELCFMTGELLATAHIRFCLETQFAFPANFTGFPGSGLSIRLSFLLGVLIDWITSTYC